MSHIIHFGTLKPSSDISLSDIFKLTFIFVIVFILFFFADLWTFWFLVKIVIRIYAFIERVIGLDGIVDYSVGVLWVGYALSDGVLLFDLFFIFFMFFEAHIFIIHDIIILFVIGFSFRVSELSRLFAIPHDIIIFISDIWTGFWMIEFFFYTWWSDIWTTLTMLTMIVGFFVVVWEVYVFELVCLGVLL